MGQSDPHIKLGGRLKKMFSKHPFEWIPVIRTILTTWKYRFLFPCTESGCVIGFNSKIINFSNVKIAKGTFLNDHVYLRAGLDGSIKVGENCAFNSFAKLFGHGGISIGSDTQIGPGAIITTTTHDFEEKMQASFHPVKIGNWVWVGANAIILSGVTIGDHVVIGAGSIVTKDIPPYSVAVGSPAKVIKTLEKK